MPVVFFAGCKILKQTISVHTLQKAKSKRLINENSAKTWPCSQGGIFGSRGQKEAIKIRKFMLEKILIPLLLLPCRTELFSNS